MTWTLLGVGSALVVLPRMAEAPTAETSGEAPPVAA